MKRAIAIAATLWITAITGANACQATAAHYKALRIGMSYEQTVKIIGCLGEEMSRNSIAGYQNVAVRWWGRGTTGANMLVFFQNGRIIQVAQSGLR